MTDLCLDDKRVSRRNAEIEQMEWSERLELGDPTIDDQHKRFFDLVASFSGNGDQIRLLTRTKASTASGLIWSRSNGGWNSADAGNQ